MSNNKGQLKTLGIYAAVLTALFFIPAESQLIGSSLHEAVKLLHWYAREHVLMCLIPAFFIAGAIGVFISQASVMKYLGPKAGKLLAYAVASVSGCVLAVCSCTVLPLFAGIYRMGAGIGPATAFLYSGPAINVLAIIMTARVLGAELGLARAIGAVVFSVVIGLLMQLLYERKSDAEAARPAVFMPEDDAPQTLGQTTTIFALLTAILVFANWAAPAADVTTGLWRNIYAVKWPLTAALTGVLLVVIGCWMKVSWLKLAAVAAAAAITAVITPSGGLWVNAPFAVAVIALAAALATTEGLAGQWLDSSWGFAKQIMPLLLAGVFVAGLLLGAPGGRGLIPPHIIEMCVGSSPDAMLEYFDISGESARATITACWPLFTNLFASVLGAFMYFATLTEIPILQGLLAAGMGKGPALALLLAGPALSLPNMLVIAGVLGLKKTVTFVTLVVTMATIAGLIFGAMG